MSRVRDEVGVVVIAHGSRRPQANQELFDLVDRLQQTGIRHAFPAFLELAEPSIVAAADRCVAAGVTQVVLAPFFLSSGRHVRDDLEGIRQELALKHRNVEFRLAGPLGPHPLLDQILMERVGQAMAQPD